MKVQPPDLWGELSRYPKIWSHPGFPFPSPRGYPDNRIDLLPDQLKKSGPGVPIEGSDPMTLPFSRIVKADHRMLPNGHHKLCHCKVERESWGRLGWGIEATHIWS